VNAPFQHEGFHTSCGVLRVVVVLEDPVAIAKMLSTRWQHLFFKDPNVLILLQYALNQI
jgi:hypothetical protein